MKGNEASWDRIARGAAGLALVLGGIIALVLGVAAALAGQPVLWVLAAGATVSGLWDVIRP